MNAMSPLLDFSLSPRAVTQEETAREFPEWRQNEPIDSEFARREPMAKMNPPF